MDLLLAGAARGHANGRDVSRFQPRRRNASGLFSGWCMTLERKDLRIKLRPDDHAALVLLADAEDCELAELAEKILVQVVRRRVHAAILIAAKAPRLGFDGHAIPADD